MFSIISFFIIDLKCFFKIESFESKTTSPCFAKKNVNNDLVAKDKLTFLE